MKRNLLFVWLCIFFCWATLPAAANGGGESTASTITAADIGGEDSSERSVGIAAGPAELSVDAAVKAAAESSVELVLEKLNMRQAAASISEAKSRRGPSVVLQASGSYLSNPMEGFAISEGEFGSIQIAPTLPPVVLPENDVVILEGSESTYFSVSATLSQPLFTWGKITEAIKAAELNLDIAGEEFIAKERDVERGVMLAYFSTLFSERTAVVLVRAEEIADEIVADRENALSEGLITRQTVLDAASTKATFAAQLVRAREAGATARFTLSKLTGQEMKNAVLVNDYRKQPLVADEAALIPAAFNLSAERGVLLRRIEQASTMVSIDKASRPFLPDVSLNLSVDVTGQKIPLSETEWTDSWDTNLVITLGTQTALFDSGYSASRVKQAEITLEKVKQGLRGFELGLELQIRSSIEAVHVAFSDMEDKAAKLDLANEIERNASVSFNNDLITRAEALGAKLAALAAELEYELARFGYETALIELESAVGKPLVDREIN